MKNIKRNCVVLNDCRGMPEDEIIEIILKDRGINNVDEFLSPSEKYLIPFKKLKNIDKAVDIVEKGIIENKNFSILWDVDLDGVASGAIIHRYLSHFTKNIRSYINNGKAHGLFNQDLNRFYGTDILIIVDSLDMDITQYKKIKEMGIECIVLDHHDIDASINYDDYITLISSQRNYPNPSLSGAGVVWKFCKYYDEIMLEDYADNYIDLAACGLVADMVDISEDSMENRYIIYKGLNNKLNPAIKKIVGSFTFNSKAIAYSIAPLVNAANRMKRNELAMMAFLSDDNKDVLKYVKELKKCKEDQNIEVNNLLDEILLQANKQIDEKLIYVFIKSDAEIAGLIGNKLLELYQRPLLILRDKEESYGGSARAIGVNDFRKTCHETGLCEANGHPLAFGININKDDFENFIEQIKNSLKDEEFVITTTIDIELELGDITRELIDSIKKLDFISGAGFKPITAKVCGVNVYKIGNMSQYKHLVVKPNDYTDIIYWNWNGSFDEMEDNSMMQEPLTVVCNLDSGFIGRRFSLQLICQSLEVE